MTSIIYDVDVASGVKTFLLNNLDDVDFDNLAVKKKIFATNDNDLLRIGKLINSPMKIVSVDLVDANFFKANLFKNGDEN